VGVGEESAPRWTVTDSDRPALVGQEPVGRGGFTPHVQEGVPLSADRRVHQGRAVPDQAARGK